MTGHRSQCPESDVFAMRPAGLANPTLRRYRGSIDSSLLAGNRLPAESLTKPYTDRLQLLIIQVWLNPLIWYREPSIC